MKNFLYLFFILLSACSQNNPTPPNSQRPILTLWQTVDFDKLLKPRDISEFTDTGTKIGGKKLYEDKLKPDNKYIFSENGGKNDGFLEAYAGTLYHFLLGKHSSFTQFVFDNSSGKNTIIGASLYEPTYQDSYTYHNSKPLLAVGSGLGSIIAASMLLGEYDLKALASASSNLGIVTKNGQSYYFKIDHGGSFQFNDKKYEDWFNLTDLKNPKSDMAYLETLRFDNHPAYGTKAAKDFTLSQPYLDEIAQAANYLASIPQSEIIKVLDFCENQLNKLTVYPKDVDLIGTHPTYKSAILERFDTLRNALK